MEEEYFVDEKIHAEKRRGKYVPVSVKLYKAGEPGYVDRSFPWQRVHIDRLVRRGTPVFVVSYIHHSGKDQGARAFFREDDAKKYIAALGRALKQSQGVEEAELHYGQGTEPIDKVLNELPVNTFVNFRTVNDEFSVTFARTIY